ncbi:hypothetical protein GGS23DRAFT_616071 [Durotheca rogersii]|uniref:uncharacterized protein n=1 Tax=Durotheca rogersii TaxID=419775 RepID=UPI0022209A0D|nr:uncharacterized protein GGS23DRAFT_616071 [Durotheca rogersii]KAI5859427.1 hypothetical protein GGS23DRAFT_616071 [Durotheca rogersii]
MHHLALYPQCGACTDMIFRHERVVALFGKEDDSSSYLGRTEPFPFPDAARSVASVNGFRLCRFPDCKRCAASPQFMPIHCDCFEVFRKCCGEGVDASARLWTVAAWRSPWRRAPPIYLASETLEADSLRAIADIARLPQLYELPTELLEMVRRYSEHALLWRAISARSLAARVSATSPNPLLTLSLDDILFWERGGELERRDPGRPPLSSSTMQLTIDSDGIRRVERPSPPSPEVFSRGAFAYVVEDQQAIAKLEAQFKDGLLRLVLPRGQPAPAPRIWNTPNPPDMPRCETFMRGATGLSPARLFAVDADHRATGITFFFSAGALFGVHVHVPHAPDATPAFRRFSRARRRTMVWVYLPLAPRHDPLLALGVRRSPAPSSPAILARTQRGAAHGLPDVVIGPYLPGPARDHVVNRAVTGPPITLVYSEPLQGRPIPFFGACVRPAGAAAASRTRPGAPDAPAEPPFAALEPRAHPLGDGAYFARAPLAGVAAAELFYDEGGRFCRGLLLRYRGGARRALGQCRVHVDATARVAEPRGLCHRLETRARGPRRTAYAVEVALRDGAGDHGHRGEEGWSCHRLEGMLNFWFTDVSSFIEIDS